MADAAPNHPTNPAFVALAAPAGLLHNSLITYLQAFPHLRITRAVVSLEELLSDPEAPIYVQVILLDADLSHADLPKALGDLRYRYPAAVFIVLVDSPMQQQTARSAGAHYVLLKGHLGDALKSALQEAIDLTENHGYDDIDLRR